MMDISVKKTGKDKSALSLLTITNECTVYNVDEMYKNIKEKLKTNAIDKVLVKDVSNIDLAGVQLLLTLKQELVVKNPNLTFELKIEEDLKDILVKAGLFEIIQN